MKSILKKIAGWISTEGKTPTGKAVEHAVVAGVAYGISLAVHKFTTGSFSLNDVWVCVVGAGTAILAGVRAIIKSKVTGGPVAPVAPAA